MKDKLRIGPEELLSHREFIRSLALRLVFDEHLAEDVAQETLLAAFESPPKLKMFLRSWLAVVTRNLAQKVLRGERRRQKRERAAAKPDKAPSAVEDFERERLRRRLVDATLALKEPYRSTILLRFYEGLPPQKIAEDLESPITTVKSHLRRGIQYLRKELDSDYGANRKKWCIALAPLAGLPLASSSASAGTSIGIAGLGVVAMSLKMKIGIASFLLLGAILSVWQLTKNTNEKDSSKPSIAKNELSSQADDKKAGPVSNIRRPTSTNPSLQGTRNLAKKPVGIPLSGRVTEIGTGDPVKAFDFKLSRVDEKETNVVHETVANEEGCFSFNINKGGLYAITICSSQHKPKYIGNFTVPENTGITDLSIELELGLRVSGIVVEDSSNRPVRGALIGAAGAFTGEQNPTDLEQILLGHPESSINAKTDAEGRFTLGGLNKKEYKIVAVHPDFVEGFVETMPGEGWIEIRLRPGFQIYGEACDDEGISSPGIIVTLLGEKLPLPRPVRTGPDGKYRTAPVLSGWVAVNARVPSIERIDAFNFTEETKEVELIDQDVKVNFGPTPEHATWQGTLFDHKGKPIVNGWVNVIPESSSPPPGVKDGDHIRVNRHFNVSNHEGFFEIRKLIPGLYEVILKLSEKQESFRWGELTFTQPGVVTKDIHISHIHKTGAIQGVVIDGTKGEPFVRTLIDEKTGKPIRERITVFANEKKSRKSFRSTVDEDGRFCIKGLPSGVYQIGAVGGNDLQQKWKSPYLNDLKLKEEEILKGLRITVFPLGCLQLKITELENPKNVNISVAFKMEGEEEPSHFITREGLFRDLFEIREDQSIEVRWPLLKAGLWKAVVTVEGLSSLERSFEIYPSETTKIEISGSEFEVYEGFVTVNCTFVTSGGAPIAGATLSFESSDFAVAGFGKKNRSIQGITDSKGCFTLDGFKPGRWGVQGLLPGGGVATLKVEIPQNPENPFPLSIVFPAGTITGSLYDKHTSLPFNDKFPRWRIFVQNVETYHSVSRLAGENYGSRFNLMGIPEGEYWLYVWADGYTKYKSEPFLFSEGQNLDFGNILIEPSGILVVEVVDENGKPIESAVVNFQGMNLSKIVRSGKPVGHGKKRYIDLPLGKVNLRVAAKDYEEKDISVELVPGKHEEVKVVLNSL